MTLERMIGCDGRIIGYDAVWVEEIIIRVMAVMMMIMMIMR